MSKETQRQKSDLFFSSIVRGSGILGVLKIIAVSYTYGYLFPQMGIGWSLYFFLLLLQWEILTFGCFVLLAYLRDKFQKKRATWLTILGLCFGMAAMFWDILAIAIYQQRFSLMLLTDMMLGADVVVFRYMLGALALAAGLILGTWRLALWKPIPLSQSQIGLLIFVSFVVKLLPFPLLQLSSVELPMQSVFSFWLKQELHVDLDFYRSGGLLLKFESGEVRVSEDEKQALIKKKEVWLRIAQQSPERIFEDFQFGGLAKSYDSEGNSYVGEVFARALEKNPELAFKYLDNYKDWRSPDGKSIVKATLQYAIQQQPDLAFTYLPLYEDLVVDNQKIAKELLQYGAQYYQNKFSFKDFFVQTEGRNNKKNLILLFWESASVVDSKEFGGLYDRYPLTDAISREGKRFTKMLANGTTSEMGHIATLMGIEPMYLGGSQRVSYEKVIEVLPGLGKFFKELGYAVHFVSTARLDFLNQRTLLEKAGYENFIENGFNTQKRYVFDAAPDDALYAKTIELVKKQTSPYFITLQSISSHIPYNTPYGNSDKDMYRYVDESFAKFYEDLKQEGFFEDGILLVVSDHHKMLPIETQEFEIWGSEADAKIIAFMVGAGIEPEVDDNLYQQTDVFYSLRKEFGGKAVSVLKMMNDIFTGEHVRKWGLRNFLSRERVNILGEQGNFGAVRTDTLHFISGEFGFNGDEVLNYIRYALDFQKQSKEQVAPEEKIYVISHRGDTKHAPENSLAAFQQASKLGADGLEFDVNYTKDGELIVFHGPKLYSTSCAALKSTDICQLTWNEVQKCRLSNGEKIGLLKDVLPQIKGMFPLYFLDFKAAEHENCQEQDPQKLLQKAKMLVEENGMEGQVVFSSYDSVLSQNLAGEQHFIPALDTFSLDDIDLLRRGTYRYFMAPYMTYTNQALKKLSSMENLNGELIIPVTYTVNDEASFEKVKNMGIRYIMTDELELLLPLRYQIF